jgi:hypothetical protein
VPREEEAREIIRAWVKMLFGSSAELFTPLWSGPIKDYRKLLFLLEILKLNLDALLVTLTLDPLLY